MRIQHSDLNVLKQVVAEKFPQVFTTGISPAGALSDSTYITSSMPASIEAVWVHGTDPLAPTFYVMVNKNDGTVTPYALMSCVYGPNGANTTPGTVTYPAGMTATLDATFYGTTTAAMTALVALEGAVAP